MLTPAPQANQLIAQAALGSIANARLRVTRKGHAEQAQGGNARNYPLGGEGARRFSGRWNHVGTPVVYASGTLSLAVLKYLVNLPISDLPADLVSVQLQIPDHLPRAEISLKDLPGQLAHISRN